MKKLLLHSIFPIILLLVIACAGQAPTPIVSPPDTPPVEKYILTDPSIPIEISVGKEFYIAVPSNPSTGYHWQVMNSWDPKVMLVHATEYQSTDTEPMPGSGGMDIWRFDALASGEVEFSIGYFAPGNTDTPEQTQTFTIKVQ